MKQVLNKAADILDEAGIEYMLSASTLLGIYRDKKLLEGILEADVIADDLTEKKLAKLKELHPLLRERNSNLGVAIYDLRELFSNYKSCFEVQKIFFKNGHAFKCLRRDECLAWPEELLKRENWKTLDWEGRTWYTPQDPERYFELYYGKGWRTPQTFNWNSAKNLCKLKDIDDKKVKYED